MSKNDRIPAHLRDLRRDPDLPEQNDDVDIDGERSMSWGWASGKPVFGVSFEWPDGTHRSFRYMHLDSDMTWQGEEIVMRFAGTKLFKVTVKGLRLEKLFYLLQDDKMRAVRESVRGFDGGDRDPVVQSIMVEEETDD
jgi:hypothetical protein